MRGSGKGGGMDREGVRRFVANCEFDVSCSGGEGANLEVDMPAYERYGGEGVGRGWIAEGRVLKVRIGRGREVLGWEVI